MSYYHDIDKEDVVHPLNTANPVREVELHLKISNISFLLGKLYILAASCNNHFNESQKILFDEIESRIDSIFYKEK